MFFFFVWNIKLLFYSISSGIFNLVHMLIVYILNMRMKYAFFFSFNLLHRFHHLFVKFIVFLNWDKIVNVENKTATETNDGEMESIQKLTCFFSKTFKTRKIRIWKTLVYLCINKSTGSDCNHKNENFTIVLQSVDVEKKKTQTKLFLFEYVCVGVCMWARNCEIYSARANSEHKPDVYNNKANNRCFAV